MGKNTINAKVYRSLKDVYGGLRNLSPLADIARAIGISPQGLRSKCRGPQFFTATERAAALEVLDGLVKELGEVRDAVRDLPTRLGPDE